MGMASLLSSLVKGVTWSKLAGLAAEYGPELYRQALERWPRQATPAAVAEVVDLQARVARLEELLLEQEGIIREQKRANELLAQQCQSLERSLFRSQVVAVLLALGCIVLLAIQFS